MYRVKWSFIIPTPNLFTRLEHQTHRLFVPFYRDSLEPVSVMSRYLNHGVIGFLDYDNLSLLHLSAVSSGKIIFINFLPAGITAKSGALIATWPFFTSGSFSKRCSRPR